MPNNKRILFVDQSAKLGGAELSLLDIAIHYREYSSVVLFEDGPFRTLLEDKGVNVSILALGSSLENVRREALNPYRLSIIKDIFYMGWELSKRARKFDVIYPNTQKSLIISIIAGIMSRKPVIWHLRDIMSREHFSALMIKLVVVVCNLFVSRIIANSQASASAFINNGGDHKKVKVIYDGINTDEFIQKAPRLPEDVRKDLGLPEAPLVGVFSRLSPWKGQEILIDAIALLPNVHALIVGDVLFGEGDYDVRLKRLALDLNVAGRVHFLGFRRDVPEIMQAVDIVIHTSTLPEPLGRVIIEGMLSKKPVIATEAGGAIEILGNGSYGILVPIGDPTALANAISFLLEDNIAYLKYQKLGFEYASKEFALNNMLYCLDEEINKISGLRK